MVPTKAPGLEALDMELQQVGPNVSRGKNAPTALDNDDMHRMGKVQQLKVQRLGHITGPPWLTSN
jgi:hypothetical protein